MTHWPEQVASWLSSEQQSGYGDIATQSLVSGLLGVYTVCVVVFAVGDSYAQARATRQLQSSEVQDIMTAMVTIRPSDDDGSRSESAAATSVRDWLSSASASGHPPGPGEGIM